MSEREKVITLKGERYLITKVPAIEGSNILRKFTGSGKRNPETFLAELPDEEFQNIQRTLVANVFELQVVEGQEVKFPVMLPSGILLPKIEEDASILLMITVIALMFNLSGFFGGNELEEFQKIVELMASNSKK